MQKIIFIYLLLFYSIIVTSQNFEKVISSVDLKGGYNGFASFADYNKDGLLDIFVTGVDFGPNGDFRNAILYKNNGDKTFTESAIKNIPRVVYGDHSWGDFNNDGTLDLLYAGTVSGFAENNITKIYKNIDNGCEFVEISNSIPKIKDGSVEWVDVNNDGLLDVFYQGINSNDKFDLGIFKNNGNETFTKVENINLYSITGERANMQFNRGNWVDFDGDGLKDVIIASSTKTEREFAIYKNLGNFNFQKINFSLPQLSYVSMDVGDINKDGLPDLVFTGSTEFNLMSGDSNSKLFFYLNKGNMNFSNSLLLNNSGGFLSQLKLGDFNNDGFLDLVNFGSGLSYRVTKFYLNNKNDTFSEVYKGFPICYSGGIDFGDFDNDKDLDILYYGRTENPRDDEITYIYENKTLNIEFPSEIIVDYGCGCNLQSSFSLNNSVDSVIWNFDDATTGALNVSNQSVPKHTFSHTDSFTISATYTKGPTTNTIVKTIAIIIPPIIKKPTNVEICEANKIFNFHTLKDTEVLDGLTQSDYEISYHLTFTDANKNIAPLSNSFKVENPTQNIFVRVQNKLKPNCYVVNDFSITVLKLPVSNFIDDIYVCDDNKDGFANFDLSNIDSILLKDQPNVEIKYFDSNDNQLTLPLPSNYGNIVANRDYIKAKIINSQNSCFLETFVYLIVNPFPLVNNLNVLVGCDANNDGISEYFDTSTIEKNAIGNQNGITVSYYAIGGNKLPSPLPNPFTNTIPYSQTIVVRLTNQMTTCYTEANLVLQTSSKPKINKPTNLYACDEGNGYGYFDTSNIEYQLIGNQSGLQLSFMDKNGKVLQSPLPISFKNTISNFQTIFVKVENSSNPLCFSETSFDLEVNKLPKINLDTNYSICDLESYLSLAIDSNYDSYEWKFQDGKIVSVTNEVKLIDEGNYTIEVSNSVNGLSCVNSFSFNLKRSNLPSIVNVNYDELGNNFIEIIASGDGKFEYSIDGINFQDTNIFKNISGGTYTVYVRDKDGCGQDFSEVTVLDYPKFFTPNDDGLNDFWQIKGISKYPNAQISIFDRFGKLLTKFSSLDIGWTGRYNEAIMVSDDYWFSVNLNDQNRTFTGHFTLKR